MQRSVVFALFVGVLASGCVSSGGKQSANRQQIARDSVVLKEHPERYPVRVSLANECLAEARLTLDPAWVARAREELSQSLKTQESFEAFIALGHVQNFSHQFEDALNWADRASKASVWGQPTPEIRLIQFEALLGLGRNEEAAAMLAPEGEGDDQFEWVAGRARLLAADGHRKEAAGLFDRAATLAATAGRNDLAGWARVQQAGCFIDDKTPQPAREILEQAEKLIPGDVALAIHWGEYHEALGQWDEAMRVYKAALSKSAHPLLDQRVSRVARKLGREKEAKRYFLLAEAGYRRAIDADEIYTLGAMARLYAEDGVHLQEALQLARENLKHVRDAEAHATLVQVEQAIAAAGRQ